MIILYFLLTILAVYVILVLINFFAHFLTFKRLLKKDEHYRLDNLLNNSEYSNLGFIANSYSYNYIGKTYNIPFVFNIARYYIRLSGLSNTALIPFWWPINKEIDKKFVELPSFEEFNEKNYRGY